MLASKDINDLVILDASAPLYKLPKYIKFEAYNVQAKALLWWKGIQEFLSIFPLITSLASPVDLNVCPMQFFFLFLMLSISFLCFPTASNTMHICLFIFSTYFFYFSHARPHFKPFQSPQVFKRLRGRSKIGTKGQTTKGQTTISRAIKRRAEGRRLGRRIW